METLERIKKPHLIKSNVLVGWRESTARICHSEPIRFAQGKLREEESDAKCHPERSEGSQRPFTEPALREILQSLFSFRMTASEASRVIPEFCIKITFGASSSIFHARNFVHRWLTILMPIEWTIQYFRVFAQQIEVINQTIQPLSSAQM